MDKKYFEDDITHDKEIVSFVIRMTKEGMSAEEISDELVSSGYLEADTDTVNEIISLHASNIH